METTKYFRFATHANYQDKIYKIVGNEGAGINFQVILEDAEGNRKWVKPAKELIEYLKYKINRK